MIILLSRNWKPNECVRDEEPTTDFFMHVHNSLKRMCLMSIKNMNLSYGYKLCGHICNGSEIDEKTIFRFTFLQ